MLKKIFFLLFSISISLSAYAQNNINNYKYIIVPKKYDFLKEQNQYQLNVLTKHLFEKSNFTAIYEGDIPEDYAKNNCLALKSDIRNESSMFTTKLVVELRDCNNVIVFTSDEGKSKEKEYKKSYQAALRNAFKSITALNYKYEPVTNSTISDAMKTESSKQEVVMVEEKIVPETKNSTQPIVQKVEEAKKEVTRVAPEKRLNSKTAVVKITSKETVLDLLYAQPIENGFQLVDSAPKVIYILQKTSLPDVFLLKNKKGTFFKKENNWIAEYYDDSGELIQEVVKVKF